MVKLGREWAQMSPLSPSTSVWYEMESEVLIYPKDGWLASRVKIELTLTIEAVGGPQLGV